MHTLQAVVRCMSVCASICWLTRLHTFRPLLLQVVVGTVVSADKRTVLVDVGYKSLQRFFRSELADAPIYTREGRSRGIPAELMVRASARMLPLLHQWCCCMDEPMHFPSLCNICWALALCACPGGGLAALHHQGS